MKLDRTIPGSRGRGKYGLIKNRELRKFLYPDEDTPKAQEKKVLIRHALAVLEEHGILDWALALTEAECFVIRLKDQYARKALYAYADAARNDDPEYADQVEVLAERSGIGSKWCKKPD